MPGRTLQHELEVDARQFREPANVRRSGAPMVELALDLQRRAGNRSVTQLVAHRGPGADPRPIHGLVGAIASAAGPAPASVTMSRAASTTGGGSASVQREPCTDCPDAISPATPAGDDLHEPSASE